MGKSKSSTKCYDWDRLSQYLNQIHGVPKGVLDACIKADLAALYYRMPVPATPEERKKLKQKNSSADHDDHCRTVRYVADRVTGLSFDKLCAMNKDDLRAQTLIAIKVELARKPQQKQKQKDDKDAKSKAGADQPQGKNQAKSKGGKSETSKADKAETCKADKSDAKAKAKPETACMICVCHPSAQTEACMICVCHPPAKTDTTCKICVCHPPAKTESCKVCHPPAKTEPCKVCHPPAKTEPCKVCHPPVKAEPCKVCNPPAKAGPCKVCHPPTKAETCKVCTAEAKVKPKAKVSKVVSLCKRHDAARSKKEKKASSDSDTDICSDSDGTTCTVVSSRSSRSSRKSGRTTRSYSSSSSSSHSSSRSTSPETMVVKSDEDDVPKVPEKAQKKPAKTQKVIVTATDEQVKPVTEPPPPVDEPPPEPVKEATIPEPTQLAVVSEPQAAAPVETVPVSAPVPSVPQSPAVVSPSPAISAQLGPASAAGIVGAPPALGLTTPPLLTEETFPSPFMPPPGTPGQGGMVLQRPGRPPVYPGIYGMYPPGRMMLPPGQGQWNPSAQYSPNSGMPLMRPGRPSPSPPAGMVTLDSPIMYGRVVPVAGDGSCGFSALQVVLNANPNTAFTGTPEDLRSALVENMQSYWDTFFNNAPYSEKARAILDYDALDTYLEEMSRPDTWLGATLGEFELIAFASAFKVKIRIVSRDGIGRESGMLGLPSVPGGPVAPGASPGQGVPGSLGVASLSSPTWPGRVQAPVYAEIVPVEVHDNPALYDQLPTVYLLLERGHYEGIVPHPPTF